MIGSAAEVFVARPGGKTTWWKNFSATSGGKFSGWSRNQIFDAKVCKTLI